LRLNEIMNAIVIASEGRQSQGGNFIIVDWAQPTAYQISKKVK